MKFKLIENEGISFEDELNQFASREDVEILSVQYSTSGLAPDEECGWNTTNMHSALITYKEKVI